MNEKVDMRALLEVAKCPCCDGSGGRYDNYGNAEQCQWCYERSVAISAPGAPADLPECGGCGPTGECDADCDARLFAPSALQQQVAAALDFSRNFANSKPSIGLTEKEHILGLASLLERVAASAAPVVQTEPVATVVERKEGSRTWFEGVIHATAIVMEQIKDGDPLYAAPSAHPDAALVEALRSSHELDGQAGDLLVAADLVRNKAVSSRLVEYSRHVAKLAYCTPAPDAALSQQAEPMCDTCHGQGEIWTGETAYQGYFQPPEPVMDTCPECSGDCSDANPPVMNCPMQSAPAGAQDERDAVARDVSLFGVGFLVDGVRVSPDRVVMQYGATRPAQTEQQPEQSGLVEALERARQFIRNGIYLGFIRMPDADTDDPAHETLPKIEAALSTYPAALTGKGATK